MKKFLNKKAILFMLMAILLITMSILSVSARYGMGGKTVIRNGVTLGNGYIWSDNNQTVNYTIYAETVSSSSFKSVKAQAGIYADDNVRQTRDKYWGTIASGSNGQVTTSPASYPTSRFFPYQGLGYFEIDGYGTEYANSWN